MCESNQILKPLVLDEIDENDIDGVLKLFGYFRATNG